MKKTDTIKWRLKEQPTVNRLSELVTQGILTKEEARQILFSTETQDVKEKEDLEAEVKFLRGLVAELSKNRETVVIKEIQKKLPPTNTYTFEWIRPYQVLCSYTDSLSNVITSPQFNSLT